LSRDEVKSALKADVASLGLVSWRLLDHGESIDQGVEQALGDRLSLPEGAFHQAGMSLADLIACSVCE
jgi:hypothetical protein